jgi:hypothetical protein
LLGAVFDPVAAAATPAPAPMTAVAPRSESRYLRLRIEILPSVLVPGKRPDASSKRVFVRRT